MPGPLKGTTSHTPGRRNAVTWPHSYKGCWGVSFLAGQRCTRLLLMAEGEDSYSWGSVHPEITGHLIFPIPP